jgi:hypothetical protein
MEFTQQHRAIVLPVAGYESFDAHFRCAQLSLALQEPPQQLFAKLAPSLQALSLSS